MLTALLIAPLFASGIAIGSLQHAYSIPEDDFAISTVGACFPFSNDAFWNLTVENFGFDLLEIEGTLNVLDSDGINVFSQNFMESIPPGFSETFDLMQEDLSPGSYEGTYVVTSAFGVSQELTDTCIIQATPAEQIELLIDDVNNLNDPDLNQGNINALNKKLANALKNITNEDLTDDFEACEKLQSFIDQLNAFVNAHKLDVSEVEDMQNTAHQLIWDLCLDTA